MMGGSSAEREISLQSGQAVFEALQRQKVDAHIVDPRENLMTQLATGNFDRVFIALHGRGGEDGLMQGLLDTLEIPYTGSGSLPLIVKPVREGSSYGASKVKESGELESAWRQAREYDARVMAESWITGNEYTVPILGDEILPMIRLETPREFYDYEAKYLADTTQYHCPCGLDADVENELGKLAFAAFKALDASGWGRVDFMMDAEGKPWLIEVNTIPGMTSHSLVPMSAKQAGMSFDDLTLKILAASL